MNVCFKQKNEKSKQKENFLTKKGFSFHYVRIITVSTCLFTQKNDVCYGCIHTESPMKAEAEKKQQHKKKQISKNGMNG